MALFPMHENRIASYRATGLMHVSGGSPPAAAAAAHLMTQQRALLACIQRRGLMTELKVSRLEITALESAEVPFTVRCQSLAF